jgi:hypothetical protein
MTLVLAGETTHFAIRYDDAAAPAALAVANALLGSCEADLDKLLVHMPADLGGPRKIDLQVINNSVGGPGFASADNNGVAPGRLTVIRINPYAKPNVQITDDYAAFAFVAEMAEVLMSFYGWDAGSSQGEALSRVMAEELHPASAPNSVNTWLSFSDPRPDWITSNEQKTSFVIGDRDPIAYGCGILFIYFLRYQLNYAYRDICGAGGSLLSDRYRNLTKSGANPYSAMSDLLNAHFGTGSIFLTVNNPFPLLSGDQREIWLSFTKSEARDTNLSLIGTVHLKPFFTCPAADYPYRVVGSTVTQYMTAESRGLGSPRFSWRVNGTALSGPSGTRIAVPAQVETPVPQDPEQPVRETKTFEFEYRIAPPPGSQPRVDVSYLSISSQGFDGIVHLDIEVAADEIAMPTTPVAIKRSLTLTTRRVSYGGNYWPDRLRCETAFRTHKGIKVDGIESLIDLLRHGPPPPEWPGWLAHVIEGTERIKEQLAALARRDQVTARELARYVAMHLGVPATALLRGGETYDETM